MDSRWLEDLVALAEAGSLTRAAALRNVTQPAFTRRIQQIEQWLGIPVIDRSVKPARVSPAILRKLEDVRALTGELRQLRRDLVDWETSQRRVSIASQHSLSAGLLPRFIARLQLQKPSLAIRLRSANREDCHTLLMTRQSSMLVIYEVEGLPIAPNETLIERRVIGHDKLCPVASPHRRDLIAAPDNDAGRIPIIGYPPDVFFGNVFSRSCRRITTLTFFARRPSYRRSWRWPWKEWGLHGFPSRSALSYLQQALWSISGRDMAAWTCKSYPQGS